MGIGVVRFLPLSLCGLLLSIGLVGCASHRGFRYLSADSFSSEVLMRRGYVNSYPVPSARGPAPPSEREALYRGAPFHRLPFEFVPEDSNISLYSIYSQQSQAVIGRDYRGRYIIQVATGYTTLERIMGDYFTYHHVNASLMGDSWVSDEAIYRMIGYREHWSYLLLASGKQQTANKVAAYLVATLSRPDELPVTGNERNPAVVTPRGTRKAGDLLRYPNKGIPEPNTQDPTP